MKLLETATFATLAPDSFRRNEMCDNVGCYPSIETDRVGPDLMAQLHERIRSKAKAQPLVAEALGLTDTSKSPARKHKGFFWFTGFLAKKTPEQRFSRLKF